MLKSKSKKLATLFLTVVIAVSFSVTAFASTSFGSAHVRGNGSDETSKVTLTNGKSTVYANYAIYKDRFKDTKNLNLRTELRRARFYGSDYIGGGYKYVDSGENRVTGTLDFRVAVALGTSGYYCLCTVSGSDIYHLVDFSVYSVNN